VAFGENAGNESFDGTGPLCFVANPFVMVFGIALLGFEAVALKLGEPNVVGGVLEAVDGSSENVLLEGAPNLLAAGWLDACCELKEPPKVPFVFGGAVPDVFEGFGIEDAPNMLLEGFSAGFGVVLLMRGPDGASKTAMG
jgi:hypothetical protein